MEKNVKIILIVLLAGLIIWVINGFLMISSDYKQKIKIKDNKIEFLENEIKEGEQKIKHYQENEQKWQEEASKKIEEMDKKDIEIAKLRVEKKTIKKKVETMPISDVVMKTKEIIECEDIQEQTQGIIFSLDCTKSNLAILEEFTFVRKEARELKVNYDNCRLTIEDLNRANFYNYSIIQEQKNMLIKKDGIIENWSEKFNLCEKDARRGKLKSFAIGTGVGVAITALMVIILGR